MVVNALEQEKAKGKAGQIAESLTKLDLVILDELGYLPFSASGGALLFHLLSKLYERTSVVIEPPRVCRRVVCSMTRRPYRVSSGLHRTPPLLLRVGCIRWGQAGGGCYTNRPI